MEFIGVLFVSLIVLVAIIWCIGMPWLALGFGGPSIGNWAWMIGGIAVAVAIAMGWWHFVGSNIHISFG